MTFQKIICTIFLFAAIPATILAFDTGGIPNETSGISINDLVDILFSILWPVAVAILIVAFIVIGFLFFSAQGDPTKIAQARTAFLGALVVSLIVLLSWSIVFIVRNTLGYGI